MSDGAVLIIGAGLAGLTAARRLVTGPAGLDPGRIEIIESADRVGGRLATDRLGSATLDHGAQFFTVRSDDFRHEVDRLLAAGAVEEWCRGFAEIDGYPRYRGAGGMNELAHHLAAELAAIGVTITTGTAVERLAATAGHWTASLHGGGQRSADAVVSTPPMPVGLAILDGGATTLEPAVRAALADVEYHRVIALLAVLDRSPALPSPGAIQQPADPTFSFIADNQAKGISDRPALTFHTAHGRSAELWSAGDDEVAAALVPAAERYLGGATITELRIERWPFSGPINAHPEPCLLAAVDPGPLVIAGDGFGASKVEGAFLSGRAAADALAHGHG